MPVNWDTRIVVALPLSNARWQLLRSPVLAKVVRMRNPWSFCSRAPLARSTVGPDGTLIVRAGLLNGPRAPLVAIRNSPRLGKAILVGSVAVVNGQTQWIGELPSRVTNRRQWTWKSWHRHFLNSPS